MDCAEEGGPALVVEGDDDAGVGERLQVAFAVAAGGRHRGQETTGSALILPRELHKHTFWLAANATPFQLLGNA